MTVACFRLVCAGILSASLVACGGGGGGSDSSSSAPPAVTSPNSFAVASGYAARLKAAQNDNFTVVLTSGTSSCSGTAVIKTDPAVAASFEGATNAVAVGQTATITFTNCTPPSNTSTGKTYYDSDNTQIGLSNDNEYDVATTLPGGLPPALPASVKVGDKGDLGTLTMYQDSTKAVKNGTRKLSYVIEPDTATTAILNITNVASDNTNAVLSTQQSRYRMAADGSLSYQSIDVQFGTTSNAHLVYTISK